MPLPTFDEKRHHVGLAPLDAERLYGLLLAGGYNVGGQMYGSPTEFGGQNELITDPTLSRWNQDDFSGGAFQYSWGKDPAMFSGSFNIIPSSFDRSVRTVPPLSRCIDFSEVGQRTPLMMQPVDGNIITVFSCGVVKWTLVPGSTQKYAADPFTPFGSADKIRSACYDSNRRDIYYYTYDTNTGANVIERRRVPGMQRPYTDINSNTEFDGLYPPNTGNLVSRMAVIGDLLIVQSGTFAYGCTIPDKSGGIAYLSPTWQRLGRLPSTWKASAVFNGALYVLCSNNEQETILVTIDPKLFGTPNVTSILPVCEFPYNFRGDSIAVFAGRVYVGGSGTDIQGGDRYAELYEVSGSSLRLVRSFEPESKGPNLPHKPKTIRSMVAHEGLLFWGDKGRGLMCYDVTNDALHGASLLQPADGQREFWAITSAREKVYAYVTNPLDFSQNGLYRIANAGTDRLDIFNGMVYTSDFAPEPDRNKRWSQIKVLTRGGGCQVGYSFTGGSPGGDTYTALVGQEEQRGDYRLTTFDLGSVPASPNIRFSIKMPRGVDTSSYTELIAFTCAFRFLDSGKFNWRFTVNGTARVETADGLDTAVQDTHDIRTELRRYWREQVPLRYRDVNGEEYRCVVSSFQESQPVIGPMNPVADLQTGEITESREAFYAITLTEV